MLAEPSVSNNPTTTATFPHRFTRHQSIHPAAMAATAVMADQNGAWCRIASASKSPLGDWYRNGRIMNAGIRNSPAVASIETKNPTQAAVFLLRDSSPMPKRAFPLKLDEA